MSKQTAVEWLVKKLILDELIDVKNGHEFLHLQSKAKEMEKEQQEMAFNEALDQYSDRSFEQYYNGTYKKDK
jgi:HEPN domain-containing protein